MIILAMVLNVAFQNQITAQTNQAPTTISTENLRTEVRDFTAREMAAHFADIKTLNPPPNKVLGALTIGEFSWGSFARALAAQAD
ncbi:MAG: hypothetical protein ABJA66_02585, partial [Actinomycetota bacterium]